MKDLVVVYGEDQIFRDHVRVRHASPLVLFSTCKAVPFVERCTEPTSSSSAVLAWTQRRKKTVLSGPGRSWATVGFQCSCSLADVAVDLRTLFLPGQ